MQRGKTAKALIAETSSVPEIETVLLRAGQWLNVFHSRSAITKEFDVKAHSNWLNKSIKEHNDGIRAILDFTEFSQYLDLLKAFEVAADMVPARYCITHRDFNTGNLILRGSGRAYGIDFRNRKEDFWLRDVFFFLRMHLSDFQIERMKNSS